MPQRVQLYHYCFQSKIGDISLITDEQWLYGLYFGSDARAEGDIQKIMATHHCPKLVSEKNDISLLAEKQLKEYLVGRRKEFDLALHIMGTEFQKRVWKALREIPYGRTASYKQIASAVGRPLAARAVGMANHHNRLPIIIPCHRVITHSGGLGGFGGGVEIKKQLLELEAIF